MQRYQNKKTCPNVGQVQPKTINYERVIALLCATYYQCILYPNIGI